MKGFIAGFVGLALGISITTLYWTDMTLNMVKIVKKCNPSLGELWDSVRHDSLCMDEWVYKVLNSKGSEFPENTALRPTGEKCKVRWEKRR